MQLHSIILLLLFDVLFIIAINTFISIGSIQLRICNEIRFTFAVSAYLYDGRKQKTKKEMRNEKPKERKKEKEGKERQK